MGLVGRHAFEILHTYGCYHNHGHSWFSFPSVKIHSSTKFGLIYHVSLLCCIEKWLCSYSNMYYYILDESETYPNCGHHDNLFRFGFGNKIMDRPSRILLEVDRDESDTRYLDSAWIGWTRMSRPIFRVNSVNSGKKFNRYSAKSPTTNLDFSEKSEIPLQKKTYETYETYENLKKTREDLKQTCESVTLSKAFKKRLGWRNPPLLESIIFIFGAVLGGR